MSNFILEGDINVMFDDMEDSIPRLTKRIIELGGRVNSELFPSVEEIKEAIAQPKHILFKTYYGEPDIQKVYDVMIQGKGTGSLSEECLPYLTNWRSNFSRQCSDNENHDMVGWGTNYDPVSRLVLLAKLAVDCDNACFNMGNEDLTWLNHNLDYYGKIGYSSQFYPEVLAIASSQYGRTESIKLTDDDVDTIARSVVMLQRSLEGVSAKPLAIEDVHERASERNNKSAESAPGFRNLKHADVVADVIRDAYQLAEEGTFMDIELINELRRCQSGGNVLFKDYYPLKLDSKGLIQFSIPEVISAIKVIEAERGCFCTYLEDEPVVLPELAGVIRSEPLPENEGMRQAMVDNGDSSIILDKDKLTKQWLYNYKLFCPNVFTLVSDKHPELDRLANKIFTKHRSIKAANAAHSRLGQSYLYPFMDAWKEKIMSDPKSPYFSLVAQWSHPDDLKLLMSSMATAVYPDLYESNEIYSRAGYNAARELQEFAKSNNLNFLFSCDDKTGFDMVNKAYLVYLFYCAFFSLPFDLDERQKQVWKMFIINDLISFVSTSTGLHMYFEVIGSGQFTTSLRGTFSSLIATHVMRQKFANPKSSDDEDLHVVNSSGKLEGGNTNA